MEMKGKITDIILEVQNNISNPGLEVRKDNGDITGRKKKKKPQ